MRIGRRSCVFLSGVDRMRIFNPRFRLSTRKGVYITPIRSGGKMPVSLHSQFYAGMSHFFGNISKIPISPVGRFNRVGSVANEYAIKAETVCKYSAPPIRLKRFGKSPTASACLRDPAKFHLPLCPARRFPRSYSLKSKPNSMPAIGRYRICV